jgi:hypothetical protein
MGSFAASGPGSILEQEAAVTYATTPMGMATPLGYCVLGSTQNLSTCCLHKEVSQVCRDLLQSVAPMSSDERDR